MSCAHWKAGLITNTSEPCPYCELDAANERIRAVQPENIKLKLAKLKAQAKLTAEREVSDKLEKALEAVLAWIDDWCETSDGDFQTVELAADAALAEVAVLRTQHKTDAA